MALHCGLTYPKPLGGIVGLSGFLFPTTPFEQPNEETPIILSHGDKDLVISLSWAALSYKRFDENKAKRKYFDFGVVPKIGHELDHTTLAKIQGFFQVILK
jgi:phospholipase/carboxylesterase